MAHNLYRLYLYAVCLALLILATVGFGWLLQSLLAFTPLRGANSLPPTTAALVQAGVFFVVSWIIAAVLGGLHYWLLRRDMQNDPTAGGSAIRSFFLNIVELVAAPLAVGLSATVIQSLGQVVSGDMSTPAAISLATLALVAVLEWERQRTQAGLGAAMLFQRLHLYGVQLILLLLFTSNWLFTVRLLIDTLLFAGQGSLSSGTPPACVELTACLGPNLLSLVAATLWVALFWVGYGVLTRNDDPSLLRQVLHYGSLAYGVGFGLYGIGRGVELLLRMFLGIPAPLSEVVGPSASYDFVSPITLGLVVLAVYGSWLRLAGRRSPEGWMTTFLTAEAITAALLAVVFWWGVGFVLLNVFESMAGKAVGRLDWASAVALAITGVSYTLFDLSLLRRSVHNPTLASAPRRGFVFALLGGGILVGAVGTAVALYALGTWLLGSPLNDGPHIARIGAAAFAVGVVIVSVYLWRATHEHLFSGLAKRPVRAVAAVPITEPIVKSSTLEGVLDELVAGKITRDEAAEQLRAMMSLSSVKV